jgi:hypothetical protein
MRILGEDRRTVFSNYRRLSGGYTFSFTNGVQFADHIEFNEGVPEFNSRELAYRYTVSNLADVVRIDGVIETPPPCCCFGCLTEFVHIEVVAVWVVGVTVRVTDQVEVCWNTVSNRTYQVQQSSGLSPNAWINLGSPIPGDGLTNCIVEPAGPEERTRYYRVIKLP